MSHHEPTTPAEWQEAVDLAEFHLHLDAAQKYGLVSGGPKADVERCREVVQRGKEKGFFPAPDCVNRILGQLLRTVGKQARIIGLLSVMLLGTSLALSLSDHYQRETGRHLMRAQKSLSEGQVHLSNAAAAQRQDIQWLATNVVSLYSNVAVMATNYHVFLDTTKGALSNHNATLDRLTGNQNAIGLGFTLHLMRYEQEHPKESHGAAPMWTEAQ